MLNKDAEEYFEKQKEYEKVQTDIQMNAIWYNIISGKRKEEEERKKLEKLKEWESYDYSKADFIISLILVILLIITGFMAFIMPITKSIFNCS